MNMERLYHNYEATMYVQNQYITSAKARIGTLQTRAENLREKAQKCNDEANALRFKLNQMKPVDWKQIIVKPLAEELRGATGKKSSCVLGPFGIGSKITIYLFDEENFHTCLRRNETYFFITLEPCFDDAGNLRFRYETGETCEDHPSDSIGAASGLNNVTAPLPDSIEEIVKLLQESPPLRQ